MYAKCYGSTLGINIYMKKRNRSNNYDWTAIQTEYDSGFSIRFLAKKYGMATRSFTLAMKRGDLTTRDRSSAIKK